MSEIVRRRERKERGERERGGERGGERERERERETHLEYVEAMLTDLCEFLDHTLHPLLCGVGQEDQELLTYVTKTMPPHWNGNGD